MHFEFFNIKISLHFRFPNNQILLHFGVPDNQISLHFGVPDSQISLHFEVPDNCSFKTSGGVRQSRSLANSSSPQTVTEIKWSEIWLSGTLKRSEISILKILNWIFWDFF